MARLWSSHTLDRFTIHILAGLTHLRGGVNAKQLPSLGAQAWARRHSLLLSSATARMLRVTVWRHTARMNSKNLPPKLPWLSLRYRNFNARKKTVLDLSIMPFSCWKACKQQRPQTRVETHTAPLERILRSSAIHAHLGRNRHHERCRSPPLPPKPGRRRTDIPARSEKKNWAEKLGRSSASFVQPSAHKSGMKNAKQATSSQRKQQLFVARARCSKLCCASESSCKHPSGCCHTAEFYFALRFLVSQPDLHTHHTAADAIAALHIHRRKYETV